MGDKQLVIPAQAQGRIESPRAKASEKSGEEDKEERRPVAGEDMLQEEEKEQGMQVATNEEEDLKWEEDISEAPIGMTEKSVGQLDSDGEPEKEVPSSQVEEKRQGSRKTESHEQEKDQAPDDKEQVAAKLANTSKSPVNSRMSVVRKANGGERIQRKSIAALSPEETANLFKNNPELPLAGSDPPRLARKRLASCAEISTMPFAESVLRTGLWVIKGPFRAPGEHNRVIILLADRERLKNHRNAANCVLRAARHTGAIIMDKAGSKSIFAGLVVGSEWVPDIVGITVSAAKASSCRLYRSTIFVDSLTDEDRDEFVSAKLALAMNLAKGNKVIILSLLDELGGEHLRLIRKADSMGVPVLSLLDNQRPLFPMKKFAQFPKELDGNEAELASFIHVHLSVDLFAYN